MANIPSLSFLHHRIKLRQLELMLRLAEDGSLRGAADTMHISQPAASKMLHELESALALQLFERHPRGVQPTVYGMAEIHPAQHGFFGFEGLRKKLLNFESCELGKVRFGARMARTL